MICVLKCRVHILEYMFMWGQIASLHIEMVNIRVGSTLAATTSVLHFSHGARIIMSKPC